MHHLLLRQRVQLALRVASACGRGRHSCGRCRPDSRSARPCRCRSRRCRRAGSRGSPHSWNHGLVRSPEASRRHSIHSPPCAMLVSCRTLQSWFSVMPGCSARAHALDRDVADVHRQPQALDLFRRLDRAGLLDRLLHVEQLDAARQQALRAPGLAAVDRESPIAAAMRSTRLATSSAQSAVFSSMRGPATK